MNLFRNLVIVLLVGFLFFGCINLEVDGEEEEENESGADNGDSGTITTNISVGDGQNSSVSGGDEDEPPENGGYAPDDDSQLGIYFIDIVVDSKQGESILVKKGEYDVLIDAGPVEAGQTVVNFIDGRVEGDLEVLVLTHDDEEHWGGAESVLDSFNVKEVWWNGGIYSTEFQELIDDIESRGILVREIARDEVFEINGATAHIMNPVEGELTGEDNDAITMKITFDEFSILMMSDVLYGAQADMIATYPEEIKCDVMQIPMHGLGPGNANLNFLLLNAEPDAAIMTGNLDIENPANDVLRDPTYQQLEWADVEVYETFEGGTVKVASDGEVYTVNYIE